jgi:transposase
MLKLTSDQKNTLEFQLRKAREASERNRLCVILGHNEGLSIAELAKVLRLSHSTVCKYLDDFDHEQKTKNSSRGGLDPKLNEDQSQALSMHLSETTYLKVRSICAYVQEKFKVTYSRSGMTAWLQAHGFVFKRPKKIPGKLDPQRQEIFVEQYEALKASLKPDEEIYFIDATHPEHQSQAVCGWIKKGVQKTLQTTGKQLRLHLVGAICLSGMKVFTREYDTVDADAMIRFLKDLELFSKARKIHVILDNAKSNKNKKLDLFLQTSRIEMHYLPPYSPNLNAIERLWKIMRETKLYNRYYKSSVEFLREIRNFFTEDIPRMTDILTSRITDRFQVVRVDPIRLAV